MEGLFARVIALCFQEPGMAEICLTTLQHRLRKNFWFAEIRLDIWKHHCPTQVLKAPIWYVTGIGDFSSNSDQPGTSHTDHATRSECSVGMYSTSTSSKTETTQSVCNTVQRQNTCNSGTQVALNDVNLEPGTRIETMNSSASIGSTNTIHIEPAQENDTAIEPVQNSEGSSNEKNDEAIPRNTDGFSDSHTQQTSSLEFTEEKRQITVVRLTKKITLISDKNEQKTRKSRFSDNVDDEESNNKPEPEVITAKIEPQENIKSEDVKIKIEKKEDPIFISSDTSETSPVKKDPKHCREDKQELSFSGPSVLSKLVGPAFCGNSELKTKQRKAKWKKIKLWTSVLAEQVSVAELKNQLPGKKEYSLDTLNKFDFIDDFGYEIIYDDQIGNGEKIETLFWLVELKLNRGMLKFYGQSKAKSNKALKNALIVALHFCTMKIVHEKVIPRQLKNDTQFLMNCFLKSDFCVGNSEGEKLLPKVESKKLPNNKAAKRRKKASDSDNEREFDDELFVFEMNLKTEKMHFCFERSASCDAEALNESLLHVLTSNSNYVVA